MLYQTQGHQMTGQGHICMHVINSFFCYKSGAIDTNDGKDVQESKGYGDWGLNQIDKFVENVFGSCS